MTRCVLGTTDLLEHDLSFALDLLGIEARVADRIRQDVESLTPGAGGKRRVVDGLVEGGVGVDVTAEPLDVAGHVADAAPFGALEEHVLVEVRQALFAFPLVRGSHAGPDLQLDDGGAMTLSQQQRQSIRQPFEERRRRRLLGERFREHRPLGRGAVRSGRIDVESRVRGQSAARVPDGCGQSSLSAWRFAGQGRARLRSWRSKIKRPGRPPGWPMTTNRPTTTEGSASISIFRSAIGSVRIATSR